MTVMMCRDGMMVRCRWRRDGGGATAAVAVVVEAAAETVFRCSVHHRDRLTDRAARSVSGSGHLSSLRDAQSSAALRHVTLYYALRRAILGRLRSPPAM